MKKIYIFLIVLLLALLGLLCVFSVMSARARMRDAVRLSDVRQAQIGLELYFQTTSRYPATSEKRALGTTTAQCLSSEGLVANCPSGTGDIYLESIGAPPASGLQGKVSCDGQSNAYCYQSDGVSYSIEFELERAQGPLHLQKGANCLVSGGFETGTCP